MRKKLLPAMILLAISTSADARVTPDEVEVRSFLNQPLQAQFRVQGDVLSSDDVEFRLAPENAYRRAGLERDTVPDDLQIEVRGEGAERTVRLSTVRPVRDPYLGLLIEIRWPAGRVLREFTILLDPAVALPPGRAELEMTPPPEPVSPTAPTEATPRHYTVREGDTLSEIVYRQGYGNVTLQQAMLATLRANSAAFIDNNVHQLRAGAELALPEQAEIEALDRREAAREVQRQTVRWREQRATRRAAPDPDETVAPAPEPVAEPEPAPDLERPAEPIPTPEPEPPPTPEPEPPVVMDRLEILGEDPLDSAEMGLGGAGSQLLGEALIAQQSDMQQLESEVSALSAQIEERDQLIAMKSSDMAQLEERVRTLREQQEQALQDEEEAATLLGRIQSNPLLLTLSGTTALLFGLLMASLLRIRRIRSKEEPDPVPLPPVAATTEKKRTVLSPRGKKKAAASVTKAARTAHPAGSSFAQKPPTMRKPAAPANPEPPATPEKAPHRHVEDFLANIDSVDPMQESPRGVEEPAPKPEPQDDSGNNRRPSDEPGAKMAETKDVLDPGDPGDSEVLKLDSPEPETRKGPEAFAVPEDSTEGPSTEPEAVTDANTRKEDDADSSLKFDLDEMFDEVAGKTAEKPEPAPKDPVAETDGGHASSDDEPLHFDLDSPAPDPVAPESEAPGAPEASASVSDEDLGIFNEALDDKEKPSSAKAEPDDDLSFLSQVQDAPAKPKRPAPAHGLGGIGDTSSTGMKIALAAGFLETNDIDSARDTLDGISSEMNKEQQAKFDTLRAQIERKQK